MIHAGVRERMMLIRFYEWICAATARMHIRLTIVEHRLSTQTKTQTQTQEHTEAGQVRHTYRHTGTHTYTGTVKNVCCFGLDFTFLLLVSVRTDFVRELHSRCCDVS